MDLYKNEETSITITGHSLGGALATLNAVDLVAHSMNSLLPEAAMPGDGDRVRVPARRERLLQERLPLPGEQGSRRGFKMEVERDLALVNKAADLLKDEYPVPVKWWIVQHKSMVKNDEGKYELRDFKHI